MTVQSTRKNTSDLNGEVEKASSDGVDMYFHNTCGPISASVLGHLARGARIAICGTASIPEWDPLPVGPRIHRQLLVAPARMSGLLVHDYADRFDEAVDNLTGWLDSGELVSREHVLDGIEQAPGVIGMLYRGESTGKLVIRLENA